MSNQPTSIFRTEALRRRRDQHEEIVLPRLVAPRTMRLLWVLAVVVLAALMTAWRTPVPTFVSAYAVCESAGATVIVLLPDEVGFPETQRVWLDHGGRQPRLALVLERTETYLPSPKQLSARFGWCDGKAPLRLFVAHRPQHRARCRFNSGPRTRVHRRRGPPSTTVASRRFVPRPRALSLARRLSRLASSLRD